ncbi:MAG: nicotinate phosphoribosyltransferase [Xanthomonadales bacterium]|nr:nicotinate phosphoribosyltransferase [Xanthomonadales bacterium]
MSQPYINGTNAALFTDLYELTMAQAYVAGGMLEAATFSLFFRELPDDRNYILSCGIEDVVDYLASLRFSEKDIDYLRDQGTLSQSMLDYLQSFRFTGDVYGLPDGTPVFPEEPLAEVTAPIPEAQLVETWILNQVHAQSVLASKAARVVTAAAGRETLDFGLRRIHGADGGLKAARAFHVAGVDATSNVLAGRIYGLPIAGTMAHSYVQAHDDEMEAFRAFVKEFPETVLLVDTYDTEEGVKKVVALAAELGGDFRVRGIRLDSGDLGALAHASRRILDDAGLTDVQIFASGGLDEKQIRELLEVGAPIDGFGVGTSMGVSEDAPALDIAYKLVAYAGKGRMKLSAGKRSLPGAKQIFRQFQDGRMSGDVLASRQEKLAGRPLLEPFMKNGRRVRQRDDPDTARERAARNLASLPEAIRGIERADSPYPVSLSDVLQLHLEQVKERVRDIAGKKP